MAVIVLLTDFGVKDYFVGAMKGVIASVNPVVHVVDLTHEIERQDVRQASFVLWASRKSFPEDAIFVNVVDPGVGSKRKIICGKIDGQIFLAPDNGLLDYVAAEANEKEFYAVTSEGFFLKNVSSTFHGRDIFAPVSAYLSRGIRLNELGERFLYPEVKPFYKAIDTGKNTGEVVYHDRFGNVFTNFLWDDILLAKASNVKMGARVVSRFYLSYSEAQGRAVSGIRGSSGLLELAINRGDAARSLKTKIGQKIILTTR
ncbi:MAG: SAM-dependent chlorinase/fluorinase [Bacteroidetes bacterium]|nr:SAM-dependent chlorinase/fluorinase [Bacteroidota bacterium]